MRFKYDAGSKWLIEHHADAILKLAGVGPVTEWKPLANELVQPRQLPDGLIEVRIPGRTDQVLCLIEINTYPFSRIAAELLDDVLLTYLNRRLVPEVIAITLCKKGDVEIGRSVRTNSQLGHAWLEASWKVVNLWEVNGADFLPLTDPGLAPWLPLMKFDETPERVLQQCKDVIDANTTGGEHDNLLTVTEIFAGLRFEEGMLKALFRGGQTMIESPVLQTWFREKTVAMRHEDILNCLRLRFGDYPDDLSAAIRLIHDLDRLNAVLQAAYMCPSLDAFREKLDQQP